MPAPPLPAPPLPAPPLRPLRTMLTLVASPPPRVAPATVGASATVVATVVATDTAHAVSITRRIAGTVDQRTARTAVGSRVAAAARYRSVDARSHPAPSSASHRSR